MAKVILDGKAVSRDGTPVEFHGFAYDGCHKIYLLETQTDFKEAVRFGYELHQLEELQDTWEASCMLRFISTWDLKLNPVLQFEHQGDMLDEDADPSEYDTRKLSVEIEGECLSPIELPEVERQEDYGELNKVMADFNMSMKEIIELLKEAKELEAQALEESE